MIVNNITDTEREGAVDLDLDRGFRVDKVPVCILEGDKIIQDFPELEVSENSPFILGSGLSCEVVVRVCFTDRKSIIIINEREEGLQPLAFGLD